jgi:hypothetical protein
MTRNILILFFLLISSVSQGQLYINEFMASNASTIKDPDFNDDADWIELYNDGTSTINLNGYFLSDNLDTPNKWMIGDITIAAKGYALFWADGMNSGIHASFKLDALAEQIGLFGPDLKLIDSVSYTLQKPDISQGRNPNKLLSWEFFIAATPNSANGNQSFTDFALNEPMFNIRGGLYNSSQSVTLFTDLGGEIRYTLDGSDPNLSSPIYTKPILIEKTSVLRARIFKPSMLPGPIMTNTYFISENMEARSLPVVSLATNPANFWDPETGIYAQGEDFKPEWEVPVNIELFENNQSDRAAFNEMAGVKINGLYSWKLPQKMLGIYFRKQYGTSNLANTLFYDSPRASFKTFALRASGNDWSNTLMRDILAQNATQLNMTLDISAFRWCMVYVNGQYMGIHNFREKIETDYIEQHYGLAAGTFDMVENEDYPECGDLIEYNELKALFTKDLSIQANFDAVAEKMDIEDFTNLVITEAASGNSSIDHNVMAWKPKGTGKWKWILMDLDRGFNNPTSQLINFYLNQTSFPFRNLMKNENYKSYFGKKLADHLYTSFNPTQMKKLIDAHQTALEPEIANHVARWLGTTSSYGNAMPSVEYWKKEIDQVKTYVEARPPILLKDLNNYGFNGTAGLSLSVYPENAGTLKLNGLIVPQSSSTGSYLKNVDAEIVAEDKAGFTFMGWVNAGKIVPKQSVWKYLDDGSNQGTTWVDPLYNDSNWKSGQGELGYGDDDEKTVVEFGSDSRNKHITTYFRHSLILSEPDKAGSNYTINLLRDDGAVVYLNGVEIIRDNLASGNIDFETKATTSIAGTDETIYKSFQIDKNLLRTGTNVLAVEIHQNTVNSIDISFDLELIGNALDYNNFISTNAKYPFNLTADLNLIAVYKSTAECRIPAVVADNMTLYKSCSPYVVPDDVTINKGATLTIEPGVEIWMSPKRNIYIHGNIDAIGTETNPITFKMNPKYEPEGWGALNFWNTSDTSKLSYVIVDDATKGPVPARIGAINGYYTTLRLDHLLIDKTHLNPISSRYSDVELTNSYIHSSTTSDLINIKYGKAKIENCTFVGNAEFDSDGIDYDGIENGIIRNSKLYDILGINADAIDIGEEAKNVIIDSVYIYNAFDKGISIGQRSSVVLTNSLLVNCNMGLGIKDSSLAVINQCIFYGNGSAVSCYEKNPGRAGGNAIVKNSILSNASLASFQSDKQSKMKFTSSLSDNNQLFADPTNRFGNPMFTNPTHYDFSLKAGSPAIGAGFENGQPVDLGNDLPEFAMEPDVMFCQIYVNPLNSINAEFIALYNPSSKTLNLSNYTVSKGVTGTIPQGTFLEPGDTLYLTDNAANLKTSQQVVQWTEGKLSNDGESIEILNQFGMVADYVKYEKTANWPAEAFNSEAVLSLISPKLDNHFPESWKSAPMTTSISSPLTENESGIRIYPNPATDKIQILAQGKSNAVIQIYSSMGSMLKTVQLDQNGAATVDISAFAKGIYLVKVGTITKKILIAR